MRIALVHSTGTLWLAGNPAVVERLHSSAGSLAITGHIGIQTDAFVRGLAVAHTDRGNLATTVSFSTSRQFATTPAAEIWSALYDSVQPRAGTLILDSTDGTYQFMAGCVVQPPTRQVIGCSVQLHYQVVGGLLGTVAYASATIDPTGSDNALLFTAVAVGDSGNAITVQISAPTTNQVTTLTSLSGSSILVMPGDSARMLASGCSVTAANATNNYAGTYGGKAIWSTDSANSIVGGMFARAVLYYDTDRWRYKFHSGSAFTYAAEKVSSATLPAGLTGWTVTIGSGSPTLSAGASSAYQAMVACNISTSIAALVNIANAAGNSGFGAVAAVALTPLTGGAGVLP
ncbi:MAG: hypothetical protein WCK77_21850 [Verrucomicrobiota bacterium]